MNDNRFVLTTMTCNQPGKRVSGILPRKKRNKHYLSFTDYKINTFKTKIYNIKHEHDG